MNQTATLDLPGRCRFSVEYTDTFGGEANYCWVERRTFEAPANTSTRALMRKAKQLVGLTGVRGRVEDYGDEMRFYPYGMATVMFVSTIY